MFILIGVYLSTSIYRYIYKEVHIYIIYRKIQTGIKVKNKVEKIGKLGGVRII